LQYCRKFWTCYEVLVIVTDGSENFNRNQRGAFQVVSPFYRKDIKELLAREEFIWELTQLISLLVQEGQEGAVAREEFIEELSM